MHEAAIAPQGIAICAASRIRDTPRPVATLEIIDTAAAGARDLDVRELDPETDA